MYNPNQYGPQYYDPSQYAPQYYVPNQYPQPNPQYPQFQQLQYQTPQYQPPAPIVPLIKEEPLGIDFSGLESNGGILPVEPAIRDTSKARKPRKKKEVADPDVLDKDGNVINGEDEDPVNNVVYADTYVETTNLLKNSIAQADVLTSELKQELDTIRSAKALKGKYLYMTNIVSSMSSLLTTKVGAIREINSSIKAVNEAEYRRFKDNRIANASNDDRMIQDMYNAFINTPTGVPGGFIPTLSDITFNGASNIIRVGEDDNTDPGFGSYLSNLSPEDNAMMNEGNPDIMRCVVYDKSTGGKYFQWRNIKTGDIIPNMPELDPMFLEDTSVDMRNKIARNVNLNMTFPVVVLNESKFNEY